MNWTGGKLHYHSKSNSNHIVKTQRKHFARARVQLQAGPSDRDSLDYSLFQVSNLLRIPVDYHLDSASAQQATDSTAPSLTSTKPSFPAAQGNSSSVETTKRSLLDRADWLGISAVKPLQISFSHRQEMQRLGRHRKIHVADRITTVRHLAVDQPGPQSSKIKIYSTEGRDCNTSTMKSYSDNSRQAVESMNSMYRPADSLNSAPPRARSDLSSGSLLIEKFEEFAKWQNDVQVSPYFESDNTIQALAERGAQFSQCLYDVSGCQLFETAKNKASCDPCHIRTFTTNTGQSRRNSQSGRVAADQMMSVETAQSKNINSGLIAVFRTSVPKHSHDQHTEQHGLDPTNRLSLSSTGVGQGDFQIGSDVPISDHHHFLKADEPSYTNSFQPGDNNIAEALFDASNFDTLQSVGFRGHQTPVAASIIPSRNSSLSGPASTPIKSTISRHGFAADCHHSEKTRELQNDTPSSSSELNLLTQRKVADDSCVYVTDTRRNDNEASVRRALADDFERVQMDFEFHVSPRKRPRVLPINSRSTNVVDKLIEIDPSSKAAVVNDGASGSGIRIGLHSFNTSMSRHGLFSDCSIDMSQNDFRSGLDILSQQNGISDGLGAMPAISKNWGGRHSMLGSFTFSRAGKGYSAASPQHHMALTNQGKRKISQVLSDSSDWHSTPPSCHRKPLLLPEEHTLFESPRKRQLIAFGQPSSQSIDAREAASVMSPRVDFPVARTRYSLHAIPNRVNPAILGVPRIASRNRNMSPYFARLSLPSNDDRNAAVLTRRACLQTDLRSSASLFEIMPTSDLRQAFDGRSEISHINRRTQTPRTQSAILPIP